jgi:hypothetical protein
VNDAPPFVLRNTLGLVTPAARSSPSSKTGLAAVSGIEIVLMAIEADGRVGEATKVSFQLQPPSVERTTEVPFVARSRSGERAATA